MRPLAEKVALVTGASAPNGIGSAIARKLAQNGATVIVTDVGGAGSAKGPGATTAQLLDNLAAEIGAQGGRAKPTLLDVTDQAQITATIADVIASEGRVDILVNNAGSLVGADNFMSTTPQDWEVSFRVNLLGPMRMTQAVIPIMQRNGGGRIINIGSTGSLGAELGFGAYTAMKHGLVGHSKTIAAEFGPDSILCNTVCPGFIATDMHLAATERLADETGMSLEEMKAQRYRSVAMRDAGLPADVAAAVAFLAGPEARYVTGVSRPVAGGVPTGI